jgi:hypothetical protein
MPARCVPLGIERSSIPRPVAFTWRPWRQAPQGQPGPLPQVHRRRGSRSHNRRRDSRPNRPSRHRDSRPNRSRDSRPSRHRGSRSRPTKGRRPRGRRTRDRRPKSPRRRSRAGRPRPRRRQRQQGPRASSLLPPHRSGSGTKRELRSLYKHKPIFHPSQHPNRECGCCSSVCDPRGLPSTSCLRSHAPRKSTAESRLADAPKLNPSTSPNL